MKSFPFKVYVFPRKFGSLNSAISDRGRKVFESPEPETEALVERASGRIMMQIAKRTEKMLENYLDDERGKFSNAG